MFNDFFAKYPDYSIVEKPSIHVIDNYKDKLPAELIEFWQEYGFGVYMDGYLKIVNPAIYQPVLNEGYDTEDNKEIVSAITRLGDFVVWEAISGPLEFDECFGYAPLLGMGGTEKAGNLQKVKIREHISLITQMLGRLE